MTRSLKVSSLMSVLDDKFFVDDWLDIPPQDVYFEEAKEMIILNIISAANEILKYYHLLFLSGEYVFGDIEDDFITIDNYLKEKRFGIDNLDKEHLRLELQTKFQDNLIYPFTRHVRPIITYFLRDLSIQLNFEYKRGIFRGDKVANSGSEIDEGLLNYISSFKRLIKILRIEHFGNCLQDDLLRDFLVVRKEFDYFSINEALKDAIRVKVSFLLKKILYRRSLSNLDVTVPEYIYSFDQQDDTVLGSESIEVHQSLSGWDDLVKVHYGLVDTFKIEQRKRRKEIDAKEHYSYSFKDYHALIKIFKDDTKVLTQAQNLLACFDRRERNPLQFNNYSNICTSAYIFNNCISLKCENGSITVEEFKDLFFEIKNRQNLDDVRNYFPWMKLAQTMSDQIDSVSKQLSDPKKYKLFTELLDVFSNVIDKLEESYSWSNYKKLIPMQLPFDECLSDYKVGLKNFGEVRLFFFSSFILPLDYNNVLKCKNLLVSKKHSYKELLTVYDRLHYVVGEVADVSEKMRKQERRSVEILAIFSAVALFSIGSIQIFGNKNVSGDPNVYYKFIMSFGYSLALFVMLIWIITRDNIRNVQLLHWIVVGLLFIGTFFAVGYFIGSPPFFSVIKSMK